MTKNEPKKIYVTKEGFAKFQAKLLSLYELRREKMRDSEEDPDEIVLLNQNIDEIEKIIKFHEIISSPPKGEQNAVSLGATVTVETDGHTSDLTIVGSPEANPPLGRVSHESPVGRALLGKRVGEVATLSSNVSIKVLYKVKRITYSL
ncbi:hypothetical protein A3A21_01190 [Candidatus Jorgensenbacteria bacterium RIFCSPLOWO2_01_FULL_45_25b]|uniref:Transcription elongation factor GreA/GreB C-terminal domain-containing protein n=1 Tax=Candidatus Jorgensenbacteria bacterium RIFCSPLOWO2_01_FULL_45_25b TaxID=1798471 RepID=A0A1F6BTI1_9BACT|nr:MAG: hypothetical protein A3A21_01190 [Candidatus Jorgensenbacteria bacterium RIFCSPLOWO2_01_FULL_45_25b]